MNDAPMSEHLIIWLICCLGAWSAALTAFGIKLLMEVVEIKTALRFMGKNALKALHGDDNPFNLDDIIDEYAINHDLPLAKWKILQAKCEEIIHDQQTSHGAKANAAIVQACLISLSKLGKELAIHKQHRSWDRNKQ